MSGGDVPMRKVSQTIAAHPGRHAMRFLAVAGIAALLGACNQTQVAESQYPVDYRQRHPITLKDIKDLAQSDGKTSKPSVLGRFLGKLQSYDVDATSFLVRRILS